MDTKNIFLIDENLSPGLAISLHDLGYEAQAVRDVGLRGAPDEDIIRYLRQEHCILITSDLDFGEFFYGQNFGDFGVIIIRTKRQSTDGVQEILAHLHTENVLMDPRLVNSLLIVGEKEYRWRRFTS